jgi:hypothetical protein
MISVPSVTMADLYAGAAPTAYVTCPRCGSNTSEIVEMVDCTPPADLLVGPARWRLHTYVWSLSCGCDVPDRDWALYQSTEDPQRLWFEAAR